MIVTISGTPGSGKTTVAKMIAKKLGYKHHSVGDLRGEIAKRHGLTIDELNEIGKTEIWTDKEADDLTKELGEKQDDFVMDSWLAFHFIPHAVKIFLEVEPLEGAKRVFKHQRPDEAKHDTVEEVLAMLNKRRDETSDRFKKYYNIDFLDRKHYDLVIDTTDLALEQVCQKVLDFIKKQESR